MKNRFSSNRQRLAKNGDFKCIHCHYHVSADPILSRVNNRNHCPYCLWSKHVDLYEAGDRLAACEAGMRPIGLTLKKTRQKYGRKEGELMLIHLCVECGQVSINRMAADDDARVVFEFVGSTELDPQVKTRLEQTGIIALGAADMHVVHAQLFGRNQCSLAIPEDYIQGGWLAGDLALVG